MMTQLVRFSLLIAVGALHAAPVAAATPYKCFVQSTQGTYHIVFFDALNAQSAEKTAARRAIHLNDSKTDVATVVECIRKPDRFRFKIARNLERAQQRTPR